MNEQRDEALERFIDKSKQLEAQRQIDKQQGWTNLLFSPEGRISRKTMWLCQLVDVAIKVALATIGTALEIKAVFILFVIYMALLGSLLFLCPCIKRLHDVNMRGWWMLINFFLPPFGLIIVFICLFIKGTDGENRFGPKPS
jgi:uncharacterized membrane protein YhaH (DUF805 family)